MKRLSSYIIQVPLKGTDQTMLIHGYTGAMDIINNQILSIINQHKNNLSSNLALPISSTIWDKLSKRGYITELSTQDEINYVNKIANLLHRRAISRTKNFGFLITYNCNFRCPYCYESKISDFGNGWTKQTFTKELVDDAYKAMSAIEPNRELHGNNLILYGGEPLLKRNYDIVKYIVEKGCALGYNFSTITNGYELAHYAELLGPDKIASLQITIDGPQATHDQTRIHESGGSTFETIISNISLALNKGAKVKIRMNCNDNNISGISELQSLFDDKGFSKNPNFSFYSALIYDYLGDSKLNDAAANEQQFMSRDKFIEIHEKYPTHHFQDEGIFMKIRKAIDSKKMIFLSPTYCGAFVGSYLFDPYRNIYSCWESLGNRDTIVGKYRDGDVTFNDNLTKMHSYDVTKKANCTKCKYVFICSGGCPQKKKEKMCAIIPHIFNISANKAYWSAAKDLNKSIV